MSENKVGAALDRVITSLPGGGEARPGQRQMAEAIGKSIESGRHLVVRAGTGTGKSLAYLVPAVLSGRRVVVATATKSLQHQLGDKDLPSLFGKIERDFEFAVLKGRSNYLCVQRLKESKDRGIQEEFSSGSGDHEVATTTGDLGEQAQRIAAWAATTTTGDQAELDDEPDARVWSSFSVSAEECPGASNCPSGGNCFAEAARARAAEADIVVVNLHLFGAHVATGGAVLPEHDVVIIDEAHEFEEIMSKSLGVSISTGRLRAVAGLARATQSSANRSRGASAIDTAALDVLDGATDFELALEKRSGERIRPGAEDDLSRTIELLQSRFERLEGAVRAGQSDSTTQDNPKAQRALQALGRLRTHLATMRELNEDQVAWVEFGSRPTLEIAPIDVAPLLREQVFGATPVIMTSATVPIDLAARLGADGANSEYLDVGSPFAFEDHALLYCAAHLPDRRRPESELAMVEEIVALMEAAGGRTLALFTSHAVMKRAVVAVRERVSFPVLVQGERSKQALLSALSADAETSLFATMGFWQGVDVPGAALSLVIIDRIPFARPDDPLIAARRERAGDAAFRVVDLPRAASLLAQGAGRLIRQADDRGVVAVLDSRLATASYRWDLIRALPPMRRTKDLVAAEEFLRNINAAEQTSTPASNVDSTIPIGSVGKANNRAVR